MEQSIRLLLSGDTKPSEQSLIAIFNKLTSPQTENYSSDLLILLAERFCDLPKPYNRRNIERTEKIIQIYSRLQEPLNQFHVRSLIVQAIISSFHATLEHGSAARDYNLKAIDLILRALKIINERSIYQPLSLRVCFVLYDVAESFFPNNERSNLMQVLSLAVPQLELHVTSKLDSNMKLFIALSLLYGCVLDDAGKSEEATKLIAKLFNKIPINYVSLRYSLLHIYAHFSRKTPVPLQKAKLDLNEQIQKAIIIYQVSRSTGQTNTKDILDALKLLNGVLDSKKETHEDCDAAELVISEIGRYAVQIGQLQLASECQQRISSAHSANARLNAFLIEAEINLLKPLDKNERADNVSNLLRIMNLGYTQGDALIVQDAATDLWSHCLLLLDDPMLVKKPLSSALDILEKMNSQVNVLRSQMHFALAKILIGTGYFSAALDHLNKAMALDYYVPNHPSKLMRPFYRFLLPETKTLDVMCDPNGMQTDPTSQADKLLAQKVINRESITSALELLKDQMSKAETYESDIAAHYALVWYHLIKEAYKIGEYELALTASTLFTSIPWDSNVYDYSVEIQCDAAATAVQAVFKMKEPQVQKAFEFVTFSINKMKELKKCQLQISGPAFVWNMMFNKEMDKMVTTQQTGKKGAGNTNLTKSSNISNSSEVIDASYAGVSHVLTVRKSMYGFNAIVALWDGFLSKQTPASCQIYCDFISDLVQDLFDMIDFYPIHTLFGEFVNFYISILLEQCVETQPPANTQQKKKASTLDPQKQKVLKQAEDITIRSLQLVITVAEKKALVDRLVEIFAKKNALPPNQSDSDISALVTIATIMNEKVQHKPETLTQLFSTLQDPIIFALLSEKAMRLNMQQLAIDSAVKTIEGLRNPSGKDEFYYLGLAHFCRGITFLNLIQPDLQEFSCQDNLRRDASLDFLQSTKYFYESKSLNNAMQALHFFTATVSENEQYPKFRVMLVSYLQEALKMAKIIGLSDDLTVSLYRILILALGDQNEWKQARKVMQEAISTLNKRVHCKLLKLSIIITSKIECQKSQTPLLDEMLRVKQLGDSKYQSSLYTFVADLATDKEVQNIALQKAIYSLRADDFKELFTANLNYAKWLTRNNGDPKLIEDAIHAAEKIIEDKPINEIISSKIQLIHFGITNSKDIESFTKATDDALLIAENLWLQITLLNSAPEDEEDSKKAKQKPTKAAHKNTNVASKDAPLTALKEETTVEGWIQLIKTADQYKHIEFNETAKVITQLIDIIDILSSLGHEYEMLKLWFQIFTVIKTLNSPRYEQYIQLKFRLFLDRLNVLTNPQTLQFPTEFVLTENEKYEWKQIVGRHQTDPESDLPPLRNIFLDCAKIEAVFGEYRNVLTLVDISSKQAEQLMDNSTIAKCKLMVALVESRSGNFAKAATLLNEAAQIENEVFSFWCDWYKVAFSIFNHSPKIPLLINTILTQLKPSTVYERILYDELFTSSCKFIEPNDCEVFLKEFSPDPHFLPEMDLIISLLWRCLDSPDFPGTVPKFSEFGNKIRDLIRIAEDNYYDSDEVKGASLPFLIRYVHTINIFGALVAKFNPVIQRIEREGIDYANVGSHASLYAEFVDKTQEPLQDLSPSAAVLYFHSIQNNPNIPKRLKAYMVNYMSRCLRIVADNNITLQNSVKYMIEATKLLLSFDMYQEVGDLALELYETLRLTDTSGAIYQFLVAQSSASYLARMEELFGYGLPDNRELLFVNERERLNTTLYVPESSDMFNTAKSYFNTIKCGTNFVLFNSITMEEIRNFCNSKKVTLCVIDDLNEGLECSIISFVDKDYYASTKVDADLEDITMRYDIFKQIIAPPKVDGADDPSKSPLNSTIKNSGKKTKKITAKNSKNQISAADSEVASNFAREVLKMNHPELQKFISELDETFSCIKEILPEQDAENVLILSSDMRVHETPFECINAFNRYSSIYRDFSIASAIHKGPLSSAAPSFGDIN